MTELTWAIIGVAAACLGIAVTISIFYRENPKRQIELDAQLVPLLTGAGSDVDVVVHHRDTLIAAPFLYSIRVANTGRTDISSTMFDRNGPLIFELLEGRIVTEIPVTNSLLFSVESEEQIVRLGPGLIKKGETFTCRFIVDGNSAIYIHENLIDVNVIAFGNRKVPFLKKHSTIFYGLGLAIVCWFFGIGLTASFYFLFAR